CSAIYRDGMGSRIGYQNRSGNASIGFGDGETVRCARPSTADEVTAQVACFGEMERIAGCSSPREILESEERSAFNFAGVESIDSQANAVSPSAGSSQGIACTRTASDRTDSRKRTDWTCRSESEVHAHRGAVR